MTLEFSSNVVLALAMGAFVLTVALIIAARAFFSKQSQKNLTERHLNDKRDFSMTGRTKYPEVDVFALRPTFLNYGLMMAVGLMILAFAWTTYEEKTDLSMLLGGVGDEIEMETPRTAEPPPPPPPPPPTPKSMQIVETDLTDLETIEFEDMSIDADTEVDAPAPVQKREAAPPPPPPPPPKFEENEKEIFKIVEESPTFPGCESITDQGPRKACAEEKLMTFIHENIRYPNAARENGIDGMVVVQFVVERDGSISNVKVVRDIGGGCGQEAIRVVESMPKWNPGKQRGRPVRVQFTLPVKFILA